MDLTFKIREAELSNLEFKTHSKPDSCLELQHMKNMRLNRSFMEQLKRHGVRDPESCLQTFEREFFYVAVKINAVNIFLCSLFFGLYPVRPRAKWLDLRLGALQGRSCLQPGGHIHHPLHYRGAESPFGGRCPVQGHHSADGKSLTSISHPEYSKIKSVLSIRRGHFFTDVGPCQSECPKG